VSGTWRLPLTMWMTVDDVDEGEGDDPDFLRQLQQIAVPFELADGEKRSINLPLVIR
jgi:hypothetical protein